MLLNCRRCLDRCAFVFDLTGGCGHNSKVEELSVLCSDSAAKCSSFSDRQSRSSQLYLLVLLESCQILSSGYCVVLTISSAATFYLNQYLSQKRFCRREFSPWIPVCFRSAEFGELVLYELWMERCTSGFTVIELPVYFVWYPLSQKWTSLLKFLSNCSVPHFITIFNFLMS